jgi:hypothetical protein
MNTQKESLVRYACKREFPSIYCKTINKVNMSLLYYPEFDSLYGMAKKYFKLDTTTIVFLYLHINKIRPGEEHIVMSDPILRYKDVASVAYGNMIYNMSDTDEYVFRPSDMVLVIKRFFSIYGLSGFEGDFMKRFGSFEFYKIGSFKRCLLKNYRNGKFNENVLNKVCGPCNGNLLYGVPNIGGVPFTVRTKFYIYFCKYLMSDLGEVREEDFFNRKMLGSNEVDKLASELDSMDIDDKLEYVFDSAMSLF